MVFALFRRQAGATVARGVLQGMFGLKAGLDSGRSSALKDVPGEVRQAITRAIDTKLDQAGITLRDAQAAVLELERVRVIGHATLDRLRELL